MHKVRKLLCCDEKHPGYAIMHICLLLVFAHTGLFFLTWLQPEARGPSSRQTHLSTGATSPVAAAGSTLVRNVVSFTQALIREALIKHNVKDTTVYDNQNKSTVWYQDRTPEYNLRRYAPCLARSGHSSRFRTRLAFRSLHALGPRSHWALPGGLDTAWRFCSSNEAPACRLNGHR